MLKKAGLKTSGKKAALTRRAKKAHLTMAGGATEPEGGCGEGMMWDQTADGGEGKCVPTPVMGGRRRRRGGVVECDENGMPVGCTPQTGLKGGRRTRKSRGGKLFGMY
jgi:hypothetical protein